MNLHSSTFQPFYKLPFSLPPLHLPPSLLPSHSLSLSPIRSPPRIVSLLFALAKQSHLISAVHLTPLRTDPSLKKRGFIWFLLCYLDSPFCETSINYFTFYIIQLSCMLLRVIPLSVYHGVSLLIKSAAVFAYFKRTFNWFWLPKNEMCLKKHVISRINNVISCNTAQHC